MPFNASRFTRGLHLRNMLSVFCVAPCVAPPVPTIKLSPPSPQLNPCSLLSKRATLTAVLSDTNNSPVTRSDHPPVVIGSLKEVILKPDTRRLTFLIPPLPVHDISNNTLNRVTYPSPTVYHPSSSFPVRGPFDLLYCIQNGGFGSTWAARDRSTGRALCLKVFQSLNNPDIKRSVNTELKMFRRMVKSQGGERGKQFIMELNRSIQHDNVVFFAMELMTTDLAMYLATDPERCEMLARQWTAQIALGINSLHEMGIIHRDIKSENILIDSRENIRIVDFGLSYLNTTGMPLRQGRAYAAEFLGTLPYMAPEVLRNKEVPANRRTRYGTEADWWALGCILFELESRKHQVLFDTEEDSHAYIAWTQKPSQSGSKYPRFEGLDPIVVNLLEGLLEVQSSIRYSLNNMENHAYFLHPDGTSEFDSVPARALNRPIRPELVPQITDEDEPMKFIEAAKMSSMYDWTNLKWAHLVDGSH